MGRAELVRVALRRCADYGAARDSIESALDLLGGAGTFAARGERILVKPNMLSPAGVERAVTTHPAVLDAALSILSDLSARPTVGDSPGFGGARIVGRVSGLSEVCRRHGVELVDLGDGPSREIGSGVFRDIRLSAAALDAEGIWNLPKWKTHTMMGLTLGVKNLYGCVPGARKVGAHLRAGSNHEAFARMLVNIWQALKPSLTVLDGVVAMEGAGPGHGSPVDRGLILASPHAPSLDYAATLLSGLKPESIPTVALSLSMGIADPSAIELAGDQAEPLRFAPAPGSAADFSFVPGPLKRLLRGVVSPVPSFSESRCVDCGVCVEACPAKALTGSKPPALDKNLCIRCYCCQELCPEGAVTVASALPFLRGR